MIGALAMKSGPDQALPQSGRVLVKPADPVEQSTAKNLATQSISNGHTAVNLATWWQCGNMRRSLLQVFRSSCLALQPVLERYSSPDGFCLRSTTRILRGTRKQMDFQR